MAFRVAIVGVLALASSACVMNAPDVYYDPDLVVRGTLELGPQTMANGDFWRPTDEPFAVGGTLEVRGRESGFGGELGASLAFDSADLGAGGTDAELSAGELWGGARQTFSLVGGRLHPYVGLGVTVINVAARITQGSWVYAEDVDLTAGLYVHGGAYWNFGGSFDLGFDVRSVFGTDVELAGVDGDVDATRVSLVLGWSN